MRSGRTSVPFIAVVVTAAFALASCEHSSPFDPPGSGQSGPLVGGDPARLTYGGTAHGPSWTPDGSGILFSFVETSRDDGDRCIGRLPRGGGTIDRIVCHTGALTTDSLDQLTLPVLGEEGDLAFVRASRPRGTIVDRERMLLGTTWQSPGATRRLRSIPFPSDAGLRTSITSLAWLDDGRLAFIANRESSAAPCPDCPPMLTESGRDIVIIDPATAPAFTVVPTAGNATSVSISGADIYYTLAGDSRVYRGSLGGTSAVVHDFGELGIVRDVHVAGGRLVAVVGGKVAAFDTEEGVVQTDEGGHLWIMDLPGGAPAPITSVTHLFSAPRLSPDGESIVAAGAPFDEVVIYEGTTPVGIVIVITGPPDLWRFGD